MIVDLVLEIQTVREKGPHVAHCLCQRDDLGRQMDLGFGLAPFECVEPLDGRVETLDRGVEPAVRRLLLPQDLPQNDKRRAFLAGHEISLASA